ncbi:MAG: nucleotidyltransferase domain-containing protein, partial [Minisyncoccales bacterium]
MDAKNKIINAYLSSRKLELYFNELKDLTKLSNSSLQNALKIMVSNNLLSVKKTKAHTFYKILNKKYFAIQFSDIS